MILNAAFPYFDINTVFIYIIIGLICILSIHIAKGGNYSKSKSLLGFGLLFFTLVFFAVLRKVAYNLGGTDSLNYEEGFIRFYQSGAERFNDTDVLFGKFTGSIRFFTDNPLIYRLFCYSIIVIGYIYCISKWSPQRISPIPYITLLIPYMRSLNTMRNSMSISLFLIALVCWYERRTFFCILFLTMSLFTHRMTFFMLSIFPLYWIYKNFVFHKSDAVKFLIVIIGIVASYILGVMLQRFIILFAFLDNNGNADFYYLTHNEGANILLNWPMYLPHILLFTAILIIHKHLPKNRITNFLITLFFIDIILFPATLILGMWRFFEYLFIPNLILWSIIIATFYNRFAYSSRCILQLIFLVGFSSLMIIRLCRDWEDASLMPYLFFWQ